MQIVHTITEASGQTGKVFNAAHVYSSLNRKMIPPVDNQGNAQVFGLRCQVFSDAANTVTFSTASNSYVTKQAVKAWYRVWRKQFADASISMKDLGPYGRVFKPTLEASDSALGSGAESGRGEWNNSMIITDPAFAQTGSNATLDQYDLSDSYHLHLLGSTVADSGTVSKQFTSVGMIESWLASRKKPIGIDGDDVPASLVAETDNPLLLARGGELSSKELMDEVIDLQKDEPPYDEQDFTDIYTQALVKTNADLSSAADIMAPLGLVKITTTAACTICFTLVGITDM